MKQTVSFAGMLEAVEKLSLDEQETFIDILRRRIAERGQKILTAEIQEARLEFAEGRCRPTSAEELIKETIQ